MVTPRPPGPEAQLAFLSKLQRLFAEGDFTATYKFALLIALADIAVAHGSDDGGALAIPIRRIATEFIRLYWQQATPYASGRGSARAGVLYQNPGRQAAVLSSIRRFQEDTGIVSLHQAVGHDDFKVLVGQVAQTVSDQPIRYLQNFGGGSDPFLYERTRPGVIELRPGAAYCLRRFQPLVQQLARGHWIDHIKANHLNHPLLGGADDLERFLFGTSRQTLAKVGEALRDMEGSRCFYCGGTVHEADVDHYVPFTLYPRDLAENFVLAHPQCNRSKSDTLASFGHLERWLDRLLGRQPLLVSLAREAGISTDPGSSKRVVAWAYASAVRAGSQAWIAPNRYEKIDMHYVDLIGTIPP